MKSKASLQPLIEQIQNPESPVGMDAVYVHALILDKLASIEERLTRLEAAQPGSPQPAEQARGQQAC